MKQVIQSFVKSKQLKLFVILVVGILMIYPIISVEYLINLDGPTHIYNSAIYNRLVSGNDFVHQFYQINPDPVPNYFASLLLSFLLLFFNFIWTLKLFHAVFIISFIYAFYKWTGSKFTLLFVAFLPLVYSGMFFNGFYNFIWGLVFLMILLWLYENVQSSRKKIVITVILLGFIYFSHSFVFMCSGFVLIIYEIIYWKSQKGNFGNLLRRLLLLASLAIPYILLSLLFLDSRTKGYFHLPLDVLWNELLTSRSLIERAEYAKILKYVFTFTVLISTIILASRQLKNSKSNYLLYTSLFFLAFYFVFPESIGEAGVFSVRIAYLFWLFLIAWIVRNESLIKLPNQLIISSFAAIYLIAQIVSQTSYWKKLSEDSQLILNADVIPQESVVYPIFSSNCWEHLHISNIIGVDNNYLILENNGARNDYFSIRYREQIENKINVNPGLDFQLENKRHSVDYLLKIGKNDPESTDAVMYNLAKTNGSKIFENELIEVWKMKP